MVEDLFPEVKDLFTEVKDVFTEVKDSLDISKEGSEFDRLGRKDMGALTPPVRSRSLTRRS